MNVLILATWAKKQDDATVERAGLAFVGQIDQLAQSRGLGVAYKLLTYAYPGQDVIGSYGQESETTLKAVSRKYDPKGFFQKAIPGWFKVFP